ncbi:MAG: V-type ATPase 116kDa subunit family protein [Candidatus Bathyarchaeia archaeon]|jgi:V/A-type H+-transporting ATPase subunit I
MLLPAKMKRVEIIVHKDHYDPVMRYLREARVLELLDVKDMIKGYDGAVSPCPTSERLYRLVTLGSKIGNLTNTLQLGSSTAGPVQVSGSLAEDQIRDIEGRVSSLEAELTALSSEIQAAEKITQFADTGLGVSIKEIMKITDINAPEGGHRLEEIVSRILDTLAPPEIEQAIALGQTIDRKDVGSSIRRAITEQVAHAVTAHQGEAAVIKTLSQALALKIIPGSTAKALSFEPESRVEKSRDLAIELNLKVKELASRNSEWLQVDGERVNAERVLEEAKGLCGKTESTYVIEGWLPVNIIPELQQKLGKVSDGHCVVQDWSKRGSPTLLRNPRGTGSFQRLTLGFGTPTSSEIDPTVLWTVTYPLFFGLMFGDVGHGLLVFVVSAILMYAKRRGTRYPEQSFGGLGSLFNMILDGSGLLMLGGAAAIVFGLLYGTFMGSEQWFVELTKLPGPLWFNPFKQPTKLLKVSIIIGIVHVSSGLILDIVNKVRNREYDELLAGPGLWLWFYLTFGYLILAHGFRLISYVLTNLPIVLAMLGIPAALMLVAKARIEGPFEGVGHWMESMFASISHTISYIRIMAMKMIHDVFSILFLGILFATPIYIGAPVFALLTIIMILVLETAFVFLQDLRLHWVEWFLKFYSGSGVAFKPFGIQRTFTSVSTTL